MPETDPFNLPFDEALAWFEQKIPLPTSRWDEIINAAQDWAFTVAGLTQAELLNDLYGAIDKALEQGTTLEEFRRDFDEMIARRGWQPPAGSEGKWGGWRTELIFMQNLQSAYGAGRWAQINDPDIARSRPYVMWRHGDSPNPRPAHLALDGKVFNLSDPFLKVCSPPSGFGCRCKLLTLSDRDMTERGLKVSKPPSETVTLRDRITGKEAKVPAIDGTPIAEPGFMTAPGSSPRTARRQILNEAIDRLPPELRQAARAKISGRNQD